MFSDAPPMPNGPCTPGEGSGPSPPSSTWRLPRGQGPLGHRDMSDPEKAKQAEAPNTLHGGQQCPQAEGPGPGTRSAPLRPSPRGGSFEGEITEASPGQPSITSAPPGSGASLRPYHRGRPASGTQTDTSCSGLGGRGWERQEGKGKKKEEKSMQSFMLRRSRLILCPGDTASGRGKCCAGFSSRWHFPQTQLPFQARAM